MTNPEISQVFRDAAYPFAATLRRVLSLDWRVFRRYRRENSSLKLNVGCGDCLLPGWLNSDKASLKAGVMWLDAGRPFRLPAGQFDYVYSEHVAEHLEIHEVENFLAESYRILKPGGKIRIVTPDIEFLNRLQSKNRSKLETDYILHAARYLRRDRKIPVPEDVDLAANYVVSNFFSDWGHRHIFNRPALANLLLQAGFVSIRSFALHESDDPCLRQLANSDRYPDGFLELESMTLEASKIVG